jgi:hypothetical protein
MTVALIEKADTSYAEKAQQPETRPRKILRGNFRRYDPPLEARTQAA